MSRFFDTGVAVCAGNVIIAGVESVTERNGLLRSVTLVTGGWKNRRHATEHRKQNHQT